MGKHRRRRRDAKEHVCEIKKCTNDAIRSLPLKKIEQYLSKGVKDGVTRRVHICKEHYKEYKKKSKKDRLTDRLSYRQSGLDPT